MSQSGRRLFRPCREERSQAHALDSAMLHRQRQTENRTAYQPATGQCGAASSRKNPAPVRLPTPPGEGPVRCVESGILVYRSVTARRPNVRWCPYAHQDIRRSASRRRARWHCGLFSSHRQEEPSGRCRYRCEYLPYSTPHGVRFPRRPLSGCTLSLPHPMRQQSHCPPMRRLRPLATSRTSFDVFLHPSPRETRYD